MANGRDRELSPYVELERSTWADLAGNVPQPLTADDIERLRGLGDELDVDEVREVYLPLTVLISMRIRYAAELWRATATDPAMPMTKGVRSGWGACRNFSVARHSSAA